MCVFKISNVQWLFCIRKKYYIKVFMVSFIEEVFLRIIPFIWWICLWQIYDCYHAHYTFYNQGFESLKLKKYNPCSITLFGNISYNSGIINDISCIFDKFHPLNLKSYFFLKWIRVQMILIQIYLSVFLLTYLSVQIIYLSLYPIIYLSLCPIIYQSLYPIIYSSIHLSIYLFIYLFIYPSSINLSLYISILNQC